MSANEYIEVSVSIEELDGGYCTLVRLRSDKTKGWRKRYQSMEAARSEALLCDLASPVTISDASRHRDEKSLALDDREAVDPSVLINYGFTAFP